MRKNSGFTLLEVMLAVAILAVISALTAASIQRSLRVKVKIQGDIDSESKVRNALRLIERDINLAFHYRNVDEEIRAELKKPEPGQPAPPPAPPSAEDNPAPNYTKFLGNSDSLHFSSLSNVRTSRESRDGDQGEVGYYLEGCDKGNCLYRRNSPVIDDDIDSGGGDTVLLDNVTDFRLKYFGEGKQDWVPMWKTGTDGDDDTRENFPQAVEVVLAIKENNKEISISTIIPLRFPNNKKKETVDEKPL